MLIFGPFFALKSRLITPQLWTKCKDFGVLKGQFDFIYETVVIRPGAKKFDLPCPLCSNESDLKIKDIVFSGAQ